MDRKSKYTPEAREKVINLMIGPIKARRATARAESLGEQAGQILFNSQRQVERCPDKVEPASTNMTARERLERQITDLMAQVNQAKRERDCLIKDALDILEMARTTAYTHPMGEVSVTLHEASRRLSGIEPQFSRTTNNLGNLAMEIRQSEQVWENQGG